MGIHPQPDLLDQQLDEISRVVKRVTGINLTSDKRDLIKSRLGNRLRALGFKTYAEYLDYLYQKNSGEFEFLVDALTTNVTSFFRESSHFDFLAKQVILAKAKQAAPKKLRIWCAGCSSGEEPYSLAMTFFQNAPDPQLWDFKILATDLSAKVLDLARQGKYTAASAASIPKNLQAKFFNLHVQEAEKPYEAKPVLKDQIRFARLNLLADWPMREPVDAIFCRNVMIYFENDVREIVVKKFWKLLAPGGWLFIGQSENLLNMREYFRFLEPAVYQKLG
jgi:chemotaxis protein methyltransferase CheR